MNPTISCLSSCFNMFCDIGRIFMIDVVDKTRLGGNLNGSFTRKVFQGQEKMNF